jgi:hypothetical protein
MMRPYHTSSAKTYKVSPRAGGALLTLFGLLFAVIGIFIQWNTLMFLPGTVSTTAVILSCGIPPGINASGEECQPTFQFQTRTGRSMTIKDMGASTSWFEGETVTVAYHPNDPQDARIDAGVFWLFLVAFGALFVLIGLGACVRGLLSGEKG